MATLPSPGGAFTRAGRRWLEYAGFVWWGFEGLRRPGEAPQLTTKTVRVIPRAKSFKKHGILVFDDPKDSMFLGRKQSVLTRGRREVA